MKKKIILIIAIAAVVGLALLVTAISFALKSDKLTRELNHTKQMFIKTQEEAKRIQTEKDKITKENEKLQADALSYVAINNDLQKEKESLQEKVKEAQRTISEKEDKLQSLNENLKKLEKQIAKEKQVGDEKLVKEKKDLEEKIKSQEEALKKERGLYHYNLAVAYTQANLYDEAIEAYEKSLTFDQNNAEAHYNLGLLYQNIKQDPEKAVEHYRKYLELKPDSEDKEEVQEWIAKLK
jgi:tetratricopeptide (TPR) repeat protein